jgi:glycosyltransferase involved in cell wall biosynthesis
MTDPVRVLVVGPAPSGHLSRGGMATVVTSMAAHPDPRFQITVVPTYLDGSRWQKLSIGVRGMVRAALLVARGQADVLHVHVSHGGSLVRKSLPLLAARWSGTPAIVHGHSFDFGGWFDGLPALAQRAVPIALPADRWLVLGRQHASEYADRLGLAADRVQVLHNAIRVPGRPVGQSGMKRVHAVMLGRMGKRKGSYDVVAAVGLLTPETRQRLRVTLAGDGETEAVTAAVDAAGLADTMAVSGWLDAPQRDALLADAQVFLLPSYDEGLPMALLEAMAAGLAPITTAVGSIGEVVSDGVNGLLVETGHPEQIAAALHALVTDDAQRVRLAAAARERAAGFSLSRWYEQLSELWTALTRRPAARRPATAPVRRAG